MNNSKIFIIIPARYASARLPAKPLQKIKGREMIYRVAEIAQEICKQNSSCSYVIATDHVDIELFCNKNNLPVVMTSVLCKNGTERCWEVVQTLKEKPHLIINFQGDNPLCPPTILQDLIDEWTRNPAPAVYTPYVHLTWNEYNNILESKKITPFSGTTVLVDHQNYAMVFSKSLIPVIRKMEEAQTASPHRSPVRVHLGIYAYTYETLEKYMALEETTYEKSFIEGLEQLRFLYNGFKIKMIEVFLLGKRDNIDFLCGVDSPEDIARVEAIME